MKYPRRLTDGVFLLGNQYISIYLIGQSSSYILLEAGFSSTALEIRRQIESLRIDPKCIHKLLLTHAHADHVMGAGVLKRQFPWLKIMAGIETKQLLSKSKIQEIFVREDRYSSLRLLELGAVSEDAIKTGPLPFDIEELISPGDIFDVDGSSLQVLDAPGHCKGGMAFWDPTKKILFCSDYLGFFIPPDRFVPNFYVDYEDFLKTFNYLSELNPTWICPGHCGAYEGGDALRFIELSRAEVDWVTEFIISHCRSSENIEKVKKALLERYFVREATMFSLESTRYCIELLIRRVLECKGHRE
ncbi:MAG: MBL fold metallo-hydrolase [Deltaproteobacteria bacterium]|nr:MBL fold metallo-hydrolase [Deltaproteobacteria bacterium]MBW1931062.1 MBL fold metallo-hydrolase [Deltaproteobacteria bacterium]MBW2025131.1 MBL fold metallo-hydrolase [Deltaproteobacteria bacterium]MBW2125087.1 MBL fold metallo-hydrolase [Deltaproteobacteria bacterium]